MADEQKFIHVKSRMACPVRQKDGTWKVIVKHFEEDIPDLGRETLMCNKCGFSAYPKCKSICRGWMPPKKKEQTE